MKKGADGKYHSKVVLAPGMKPVYYEASTVRELERKRQAILDAFVNGSQTASKPFVDVAQEWFDVVKKPRTKALSTAVNYAHTLNTIKTGMGDRILMKAVTYKALQQFVDRTTAGHSLSYSAGIISMLRQICRYAVAQGYTEKDPSAALMKPADVKNGERHALTPDQVRELMSYQQYRPGLALMIAYYTGCRLSEVLAMTWADIDWSTDEISINKALARSASVHNNLTGTKTKAGERRIPLLPELKAILFPLRGFPSARILPPNALSPYSHSTYLNDWADLKKQGVKPTFTAHWLRHHFATSCYLAGIPLTVTMQWLGHASYKMTADTYTDIKRAIEGGDQVDRTLSESLQKVGQKLDNTKRAGVSKPSTLFPFTALLPLPALPEPQADRQCSSASTECRSESP